jgi:hypothetical protein
LRTSLYWPGCSKLSRAVQKLRARRKSFLYARHPKMALRVLWAEPRQGAIYSPEGFARLAAKVLSGSLVLPR